MGAHDNIKNSLTPQAVLFDDSAHQYDVFMHLVESKAATAWEYIDPNGTKEIPPEPQKPQKKDPYFTQELALYREERSEREAILKLVNQTQVFIDQLVHEKYHYLYCNKKGLRNRLSALTQYFKPNDLTREYDIDERYVVASRPFVRGTFEDWLATFEKAYIEAREINAAITRGAKSHLDLLRAIRTFVPGFADPNMVKIQRIIRLGKVEKDLDTMEDLIKDLIAYLKNANISMTKACRVRRY
jgi:hypothetical protein